MIVRMLQDVPGIQVRGKLATLGKAAAAEHIKAGRAETYVPPRFRSQPGQANQINYQSRIFLVHDCPGIGFAGDTVRVFEPETSFIISNGYGVPERLARDQTQTDAAARRGKGTKRT